MSSSIFQQATPKSLLLKGQCHEIVASGFFHESSSPKPLKIALGSFQIFSKILGDIRKSRCSTSINDTGGKFGNSIGLLHDTLK
jgi:hypothetical protein